MSHVGVGVALQTDKTFYKRPDPRDNRVALQCPHIGAGRCWEVLGQGRVRLLCDSIMSSSGYNIWTSPWGSSRTEISSPTSDCYRPHLLLHGDIGISELLIVIITTSMSYLLHTHTLVMMSPTYFTKLFI